MNRRTRRLAGGAAALGAGAILIGPISALAQSDDDPPATTPATTDDSTTRHRRSGDEAPAPRRPSPARGSPTCCSRSSTPARSPRPRPTPSPQALQDARPGVGRPRSRRRHGGLGRRSGRTRLAGDRRDDDRHLRGRPAHRARGRPDAGRGRHRQRRRAAGRDRRPRRRGHDEARRRPSPTAASSRPTPTSAWPTLTERITTAVERGLPRQGRGRLPPPTATTGRTPPTTRRPRPTPTTEGGS